MVEKKEVVVVGDGVVVGLLGGSLVIGKFFWVGGVVGDDMFVIVVVGEGFLGEMVFFLVGEENGVGIVEDVVFGDLLVELFFDVFDWVGGVD